MENIELPEPPKDHVWRVKTSSLSSEYVLELVHKPTNKVVGTTMVYIYTISAESLIRAATSVLMEVEAKRRALMYLGEYPKGRLAEVEREVNGGDSE